jgi:hypothetical protein
MGELSGWKVTQPCERARHPSAAASTILHTPHQPPPLCRSPHPHNHPNSTPSLRKKPPSCLRESTTSKSTRIAWRYRLLSPSSKARKKTPTHILPLSLLKRPIPLRQYRLDRRLPRRLRGLLSRSVVASLAACERGEHWLEGCEHWLVSLYARTEIICEKRV